jgi:hypothetical protein
MTKSVIFSQKPRAVLVTGGASGPERYRHGDPRREADR